VQIGYSALPGIAFLLLMMPAQTYVMKHLFAMRKKSMVWTDKRAKLLQEILGGMRIVKFMAWEIPFLERLRTIRGMELKYVRSLLVVRSAMMAFAMSLPILAAILSFVTYKLTAHSLQAATIFSVITLFQLMRMPLMIWPMALSATADAINALGRLEHVFDAEVLIEGRHIDPALEEAVRLEHASFIWDAAPIVDDAAMKKLTGKAAKAMGARGSAAQTAKKRKHRKLTFIKKKNKITLAEQSHAEIAAGKPGIGEAGITRMGPPDTPGIEEKAAPEIEQIFKIKDISLSIPRGSLTAIVGAIGSGKSSLLQGFMGEMRRTDGKVTFSGSTSLCAQTPWIQNATIRENILFGQPWDEERYWAAVRDSCLEPDLELLEDGDGTEIGEKGITLSGGQKQRVNIARAIYFNADIIALDDPLSALDAGVGKAVFFNAIVGALSGKTRILVTHALHFLPHVDNIILMDEGRIVEQGSYSELKAKNGEFARLIREFGSEEEAEERDENEAEAIDLSVPMKEYDRSTLVAKGTAHILMQAEERNSGALKKGTYLNYFKSGKGAIMAPMIVLSVILSQAFTIMTSFWLVYWQEYKWSYGDGFYMGIYAGLGIGSALSLFFQGFSMAVLNYFASVRLHHNAITRVMFAPQSFFDTTPLGRIMNRFAKVGSRLCLSENLRAI
jgi:ABC-type multidrug transport system fused ATPase/permease subunit